MTPAGGRAPLPAVAAGLPFRLGTTSYVYPANIVPNVEALAGRVRDVELVLFESHGGNLPGPRVVRRLAGLAAEHDLTYTVHFPIDRRIGHRDPDHRAAMAETIRRIVSLTLPLRPFGYVLHLDGLDDADPAADVTRWQRDVVEALGRALDGPAPAGLFGVENLGYPFEWCEPIVDRFGLSVCVDVGHLWRYGVDAAGHLRRHLPRTRIVHLHGERGGRDHRSLDAVEPARLHPILDALRDYHGVVTLEVFDYDAARTSIERIAEWHVGVKDGSR